MAKGYTGSTTKPAIRDLFQTPKFVFNWYNKQYKFTCDVAASDHNHLVPNYLTEADDALSTPWGKVNWCNPPYSNIRPWVDKAIDESTKGKTTVMLVPADTSVAWFREAFYNCTECEFISGRISFINAETGKPQSGNNKGSVVFVFDGGDEQRPAKLIDRCDMENADR
jgi:phage N-6-adenine-methyltransferase